MRNRSWWGGLLSLVLAVALAGCERSLTDPEGLGTPGPLSPAGAVLLRCDVDVRAESVRCAAPTPDLPDGVSADVTIGGQDINVKLTSSGTAYDTDTNVFSSNVRAQNLTRHYMGTTDGVTVDTLKIFFHSGPTVTSGTGAVSVLNEDGTDAFTASGQPYFAYVTILEPLEISGSKEWQFDVDDDVLTFSFLVYVSAPLTDEVSALLGSWWTGEGGSGEWTDAANWRDGAVPDSTVAASVPTDSLVDGPQLPQLSADAAVLHLRVGSGMPFALSGNELRIYGNVDAVGGVSGGNVVLAGATALVGGSLPTVEAQGDAVLQRATSFSGPLTVSGSLTTNGLPISIAVP